MVPTDESYFATFRTEKPAAEAAGLPLPTIRPARPEDLDGLAVLSQERNGGTLDEHHATFAKELRENPGWVNRLLLVGVVDDRLAGFGRVVFFQSSPNAPENVAPTGWYLGGVIVTPAHRRRGIGYELTRQRLEWIRARAEEVFYVVNALNRASAALHERFGFEELTRDFFIPGASFIGGVGILYRARLCETP